MFDARFHQQPINHDFDGVVSSLVQRNVVFEIDQFAVNARPGEAVLHQLLHLFLKLALASSHDGCEHHHPIFRRQAHDSRHNLFCRLPRNRPSAVGTMRNSDRSK